MDILNRIDIVGKKFGYNKELIDALKRCIQVMVQGKTQEDINLLMDTLERVRIYTFDNIPKHEEIDMIIKDKLKGRNNHVNTISLDKGEYGKEASSGAYVSESVFDSDMNIVDRVGFIYITNLYEGSNAAKFYGTRINLSHLIHELGHAWAAQKGEYVQDENGNYIMQIGAAKFYNIVDRKKKTVKEDKVEGLYIEEALNSIEEENALYRLLDIETYRSIPGYVQSNYQGAMTSMMRYYIEKLGQSSFESLRMQKDRKNLDEFQEIFDETPFTTDIQGEDYYKNKEKALTSAQFTNMSEESKKRIEEFFSKYRQLYLQPHMSKDFLGHLDRVMEQLFDFQSIKYNFDIFDEGQKQAFQETQIAILKEGYIPINQASDIIEERKKRKESPEVTISKLAREALDDKIRLGEVSELEANEKINGMEDKSKDESSL